MIPRMHEMDTPQTRGEFEHRFHKLKAMLAQNKIHGLAMMADSFLNLRLLPNKRLDLLSIDESARLQANMMSQMERFKELMLPPEPQPTEPAEPAEPQPSKPRTS